MATKGVSTGQAPIQVRIEKKETKAQNKIFLDG
jgi:hypothetical protein